VTRPRTVKVIMLPDQITLNEARSLWVKVSKIAFSQRKMVNWSKSLAWMKPLIHEWRLRTKLMWKSHKVLRLLNTKGTYSQQSRQTNKLMRCLHPSKK